MVGPAVVEIVGCDGGEIADLSAAGRVSMEVSRVSGMEIGDGVEGSRVSCV